MSIARESSCATKMLPISFHPTQSAAGKTLMMTTILMILRHMTHNCPRSVTQLQVAVFSISLHYTKQNLKPDYYSIKPKNVEKYQNLTEGIHWALRRFKPLYHNYFSFLCFLNHSQSLLTAEAI